METEEIKGKNYNTILWVVGIILAITIGVIYVTPKLDMSGTWMDFLPAFNAFINGTVTVLLIVGLIQIKNGKVETHKKIMTACIGLSAMFLLSYIAYHVTHESTKFGGEGAIKMIYLIILFSHIVLATVIAPLALISFTRALSQRFDKHRKIARITWPLWFYVSFTGVIVYLMIAPYY